MLFVLNRIVHQQKRFLAVINPVFDQLPQISRRKARVLQKISYDIVTDIFQMI
jgi:hypothetical protein